MGPRVLGHWDGDSGEICREASEEVSRRSRYLAFKMQAGNDTDDVAQEMYLSICETGTTLLMGRDAARWVMQQKALHLLWLKPDTDSKKTTAIREQLAFFFEDPTNPAHEAIGRAYLLLPEWATAILWEKYRRGRENLSRLEKVKLYRAVDIVGEILRRGVEE